MKKHQSEVLPLFSSNWTRCGVHLSTCPQLTSSGRWTTDDDSGHFCSCHNVVFIPPASLHPQLHFPSEHFLYNFYCSSIWRLRSFLFFSFHYFSSVLPSPLLIVQTWHYCFLRLTRQEENTTSTATKPGQKTAKGSLFSVSNSRLALSLCNASLSLSLSFSIVD